MITNDCTQVNFNDVDHDQIILHIEQMLDYAKTVNQQEDYTALSEFHRTLYGNGEELNVVYAHLNAPANNVFSYEWSVNSPHTIVSGGELHSNTATIEVNSTTVNLTTTVTVTNNCTNQSGTITAITQVQ